MPDEDHTDAATRDADSALPGGEFSDDRLLACALGLGDDPELAAAAAVDGALAARLETIRAQVDAVGARVSVAVPAPAEDYTDLSSPRWAALGEFLAAPAPKPARSRSSRWLRVIAPALAVVLAIGVGAAIISSRSGTGSSSSSTAAEGSKAAPMAAGSQDAATANPALGSLTTPVVSLTDQARRFATVVIARARDAVGGFQQFAVLRDLKGAAPHLLRLRVGDAPADAGKLHVVLLDPLSARASPEPSAIPSPLISVSPAAATIAGATPAPSPAGAGSTGSGPAGSASPEPGATAPTPASAASASPSPPVDLSKWALAEPTRSFSYHGQVAFAEELPPGTDVTALSLP